MRAALCALAALPTSDELLKLAGEAHECERIVEGWASRSPTAEEREALMRRILSINVAVARLGRPP